MISFSLDKDQETMYLQWKEEVLNNIQSDVLGIKEHFLFIPCSAGLAVKVICGKHELDLTNYNNLTK